LINFSATDSSHILHYITCGYWCYDYRIGDRNRILFGKSNWIEIDFFGWYL